MPCDFEVIEVYRNLCEGKTTLEEVMMHSDQQVPEKFNLYQDPPLSNVTFDVEPNVNEVIGEDIPSAYLPSAGCTTITEVPDQQIISGNSPSHITNLDLYSCADTTFYDVTTDRKPHEMSWIEEESLDADVNDVLYHLATKEILEECQMLNISKDPTQWTTEDVSRWIRHTCKKYDIPQVELEMFHMNGKCLCLLSEVDFLWRTEHGSHLFSQLEIWKNFYKIEYEQNGSPQYHDTTMVDSTSFDTYSLTPSSPSGSSLDSIPSTVVSSPVSSPEEKYLISEKRAATPTRTTEHKQTIHLWQFLKELLMKPESFSGCIKWVDRTRGIFKIEDSGRVAKEWGRRKNRPAMNYDKLSRSIRQYYKKGIIKKTEQSKRLVYQFCAPYL